MYVWLWRHLPGTLPFRLTLAFGLLAAVLALLFGALFPWLETAAPWTGADPVGSGAP